MQGFKELYVLPGEGTSLAEILLSNPAILNYAIEKLGLSANARVPVPSTGIKNKISFWSGEPYLYVAAMRVLKDSPSFIRAIPVLLAAGRARWTVAVAWGGEGVLNSGS